MRFRLADYPVLILAKIRKNLDHNKRPTNWYFARDVVVKEDGFNWLWPPRQSYMYCWDKFHEPVIRKHILEGITPGTVFFDVGANAGEYTIRAAQKGALVVAFEPSIYDCFVLRENLHLNNLTASVLPVALSDQTGILTLNERWSSMNSNLGACWVNMTLDEISEKLPVPKIIKIDVEGQELSVIRGGRHMLAKHHQEIFLEFHEKYGVVRNEAEHLLEELEYEHELVGAKHIIAHRAT